MRHFLPLLQHFLKADQVQSLSNVINVGPLSEPRYIYPEVLECVQFPAGKRLEYPIT